MNMKNHTYHISYTEEFKMITNMLCYFHEKTCFMEPEK